MPTLPDVPNVLKVLLNWGVEGDTAAITQHYFGYTGAAPSSANCTTMASSAVSTADTAFGALASNYTGVISARVIDLSSMSGGDGEAGTPWVGTGGTALLSPATAVLVNHQIGRRYRGGKPRTYLPLGVAADVATTGLWTTGFVASVDSAWGSWVAAMEGAGAGVTITNLVNVSYFSGFTNVPYGSPTKYRRVPTPRATPLVDQVLGHTTSRQIASQRRRNRDA